jgi:tetratricopeptide (TPR) repeat protein
MAHLSAGLRLLAKGDWLEARPLIERGLAEYRKGNIFISLPHAIASSALMLAHIGEASEALSRLREGEKFLDRMTARGTIDQSGMDYQWLGRAALLLGDLDGARRLADSSLKNSPLHPGYAAHALHLLGDIATHTDSFDAETYYRKAFEVAERLGVRPLLAHCHLGLSKLYQRTSRQKQAREHVTTATAMYREMDMSFYLQQAKAVTRKLT